MDIEGQGSNPNKVFKKNFFFKFCLILYVTLIIIAEYQKQILKIRFLATVFKKITHFFKTSVLFYDIKIKYFQQNL